MELTVSEQWWPQISAQPESSAFGSNCAALVEAARKAITVPVPVPEGREITLCATCSGLGWVFMPCIQSLNDAQPASPLSDLSAISSIGQLEIIHPCAQHIHIELSYSASTLLKLRIS